MEKNIRIRLPEQKVKQVFYCLMFDNPEFIVWKKRFVYLHVRASGCNIIMDIQAFVIIAHAWYIRPVHRDYKEWRRTYRRTFLELCNDWWHSIMWQGLIPLIDYAICLLQAASHELLFNVISIWFWHLFPFIQHMMPSSKGKLTAEVIPPHTNTFLMLQALNQASA